MDPELLGWILGIAKLIVILSALVIAHEGGHFLAAKLCKMRVEDFSLFFGPVLWRIGKRGDTVYNVRSFPLGGFVKIAGMEADDISSGQPILAALRSQAGRTRDTDPIDRLLADLDRDGVMSLDPQQVSQEVRGALLSAVQDGTPISDTARADLRSLRVSPRITETDHKLIDVVLHADLRAHDPALYSNRPLYQRAIAIVGGPLASLVFGFVLFCLLGMSIGLPTDKATNQIAYVEAGWPAKLAGLRIGDRVLSINGVRILEGKSLTTIVNHSIGKPLDLDVQRDGRVFQVTVVPKPFRREIRPGVFETIGRIGIAPDAGLQRYGPMKSVALGTRFTLGSLVMLAGVVWHNEVKDNVGGPIAMGQMTTALQRLGTAHLVIMAAGFSLSFGVVNLLPIPILDGGHLLLLGLERLRRRKLSSREVFNAQIVGIGILAFIVVFVFYNDIARTLAGQAPQ